MNNDQGTAKTLSPEDQEWFRTPVDVQVPPDNQKWLDNLMQMTSKELYDFAVYRYQVPEAAAKVSSRNDLIQLVVMANAAGGGGSVIRTKFRYLNGLKGKVPPYTQKIRGGRLLFLTRGEGDTMQVYDKQQGEWRSVRDLGGTAAAVGHSTEPQINKDDLQTAQNGSNPASTEDTQVDPIRASLALILPALEKMNREQLSEVVRQLGVDDTSVERFPTNADLQDFIRNAAGTEQ